MKPIRFIAIILVAAGILILAYGSFTYTKKNHTAKLGVVELSVKEKETVFIPMWVGVASIAVGGVLLVLKKKT